jgi:hypothetical protein
MTLWIRIRIPIRIELNIWIRIRIDNPAVQGPVPVLTKKLIADESLTGRILSNIQGPVRTKDKELITDEPYHVELNP